MPGPRTIRTLAALLTCLLASWEAGAFKQRRPHGYGPLSVSKQARQQGRLVRTVDPTGIRDRHRFDLGRIIPI